MRGTPSPDDEASEMYMKGPWINGPSSIHVEDVVQKRGVVILRLAGGLIEINEGFKACQEFSQLFAALSKQVEEYLVGPKTFNPIGKVPVKWTQISLMMVFHSST